MQTEIELYEVILKITLLIRNEYPELVKYLNEMVITIPDVASPEMTIKVFQD